MKVLIIEDEPLAQKELKRLLQQVENQIVILECIDTVEDSVLWLNEHEEPDLIFMDIQLADGISFDIFKHTEINVPLIFTTAFDEYAIKAFEHNSVDYLLKPIEIEKLTKAIEKYKTLNKSYQNNEKNTISQEQINRLIAMSTPVKEYKSRVLVKIGEQFKFIKTDEIAYFFADNNDVWLVSFTKKEYIIEHSLNQLDELLNPKNFFRINRSYIVNIEAIEKIHKFFNSRLKIELNPQRKENILVSRLKVSEFLNWIEK